MPENEFLLLLMSATWRPLLVGGTFIIAWAAIAQWHGRKGVPVVANAVRTYTWRQRLANLAWASVAGFTVLIVNEIAIELGLVTLAIEMLRRYVPILMSMFGT